MKYLVLGSSGQIGQALVNTIKKNLNHEVFVFDIENGPTEDLRIPNNELLLSLMKKADFVFFLAFDVGGSRYLKTYQNTYDFITNNMSLMTHTFEALKKSGTPFIFASSQMANMSYSSYGLLKSVGEKMTEIMGGLVVKFWNVYGLEHDESKFHVITDLIIKAAKTGTIDLMTDGREERQFLYADDCSACLLQLSNRYDDIPRDRKLHITNFIWHSVLDVASIISAHFPGSQVIPNIKKDEVQQNKRNEPDPYILTHWEPTTDLEQGIEKIVREMKTYPELFSGMPLK